MVEDQRAFWSAVVQIIPVLIVALVIELRSWRGTQLDWQDAKGESRSVSDRLAITALFFAVFIAVVSMINGLVKLSGLMGEMPPSAADLTMALAIMAVGVLSFTTLFMPVWFVINHSLYKMTRSAGKLDSADEVGDSV